MQLLDCYVEAYHNVCDRDEKRLLAQAITNIMYRRPRVDMQSSYFLASYRLECVSLRLHTQLIKAMLDTQVRLLQCELMKRSESTNLDRGL